MHLERAQRIKSNSHFWTSLIDFKWVGGKGSEVSRILIAELALFFLFLGDIFTPSMFPAMNKACNKFFFFVLLFDRQTQGIEKLRL